MTAKRKKNCTVPAVAVTRGKASARYTVLSAVLIALLVALALLVLARRSVIQPLARLTDHVTYVGSSAELELVREPPGSDEVTALAREFNAMVRRIRRDTEKRWQVEEALREYYDATANNGAGGFLSFVDIQRDDQAADLNNPIVKMWMGGEIASGRISAPGWSDPRLRAAWIKGTWRGPSIPDIDPAKLARAYRDHIEMGTDSAERISQRGCRHLAWS